MFGINSFWDIVIYVCICCMILQCTILSNNFAGIDKNDIGLYYSITVFSDKLGINIVHNSLPLP